MHKILIAAGLAVFLGGCSMTLGCPTGQTAVSMGANGELVYTKVMGKCPPPSGSFKSLSDGPMPAPPPGKEWWNLFR